MSPSVRAEVATPDRPQPPVVVAGCRTAPRKNYWWHPRGKGRVYRWMMRRIHRRGWCWMQESHPDGDVVYWCHWCGMRGRR